MGKKRIVIALGGNALGKNLPVLGCSGNFQSNR